MQVSESLSAEEMWLLVIIHSVPYVEGRTRLQKFGIMSSYKVLNDEEFFDDWRPDDHGGSSPRLTTSLIRLEWSGHVQSDEIVTEYGLPVTRYTLTKKGMDSIKEFVVTHSSKRDDVITAISGHFSQTLTQLLDYMRQTYPELTVSKEQAIRRPSVEFAESSQWQNMLDDRKAREMLARSIGLEKAPDTDPQSLERLSGILADEIDEDFDPVELVREVRGN